MEEYVSYHKIIQLFQDYQVSQQGIGLNSFGHGNIVMFGMTESGMTPTYPFMFVTPQNISYDENIITYTLQLIFADRINDDMSNEIDVISDMDIQARRFMSYIRRGMNQNPPLWNYMDCNLPLTGLPFLERFNDYVGGITIDMEVIIRTDINACDYYELLPSPTPSITPTNTPTNTTTPTTTPTNNPSITPSVTPTNTSTPSTTPTNTPTPTCPVFTTQYLQTETSGGYNNIKLTLFDTSGFTGNANAVCDYTISGTCLEFGITRTWSTTMQSNDHTHTFSTGLGAITNPITTSVIPNCGCVNVIPVTTPTPSTTPTNTPSVTPTNTTTPTTTPSTTPPVTPTPTCACYRYTIENINPSGSGTYFYYVCPNGLVDTITVTAGNTATVCSISTPTKSTGSTLIVTKIGNCC
jgi:hypothetical protein